MLKLIRKYQDLDRIDRLGIETIAMLIIAFTGIIVAALIGKGLL